MNGRVNQSLSPLVQPHIYFLQALLSDRIAISFTQNFNIKRILDLDEDNYINKGGKETDLVDDDDNKDQ